MIDIVLFLYDVKVDANTHTLAKYFMELTVVEYDLAHICPSEVAAASLCLSMKLICDTPDWVSSGYVCNLR